MHDLRKTSQPGRLNEILYTDDRVLAAPCGEPENGGQFQSLAGLTAVE